MPSATLGAENPAGTPAPIEIEVEVEAEPEEESEEQQRPRYKDGVYILQGDFYTSFAENSWRILSGPFHYDTRDWITVGVVVSVVNVPPLTVGIAASLLSASLSVTVADPS